MKYYPKQQKNKKHASLSVAMQHKKKLLLNEKKTKHLVYGISTYNRIEYFKQNIESWDKTRNRNYKWTLIICDDGSDDGTKEYIQDLKIDNVGIIKHFNSRRGIHYQINQILKYCSKIDFDFGFCSEDDLKFLKKGWDDLYLKSSQLSGFDHLIFHDPTWRNFKWHKGKKSIIDKNLFIQSKVKRQIMGIFWTFTPRVIKKIGYFDVENFGLTGHGHVDYSKRCCRVGFNEMGKYYDALKSEDYIYMFYEDYKRQKCKFTMKFIEQIGVRSDRHQRKIYGNKDRIYIPYREFKFNMNGEVLF